VRSDMPAAPVMITRGVKAFADVPGISYLNPHIQAALCPIEERNSTLDVLRAELTRYGIGGACNITRGELIPMPS
jgi:hypothetical protein